MTSGWIRRAPARRSLMDGPCSAERSVVVIGRAYDRCAVRASGAHPLQHVAAPRLRSLRGVERVEGEPRYPGRWIGDQRREIFHESGRLVEAAALGQSGHEAKVLDEEP